MRNVVIIGGGISGLATAFFLSRRASQQGHSLKITVLEAKERFGGVLQTWTQGDLVVEAGADAFDAAKRDAEDLCRELGLCDELVEAPPCFRNFFLLKNKKSYRVSGFPPSLSDVQELFRTPLLRFPEKCRILLEPWAPRGKGECDESFGHFMRRRLGEGFYREILKPVVQGVYMIDPEQLSLGAMFPGLKRAGSFRFKKSKNPAGFLTLKHGFERLVVALLQALKGCELRTSTSVRQCIQNAGWDLLLENGERIHANALCLAMSAHDAAGLLTAAVPELSQALREIRYDSIATVNLVYKAGDIPDKNRVPGFFAPAAGGSCSFSSLKWLGPVKTPPLSTPGVDEGCVQLRAFISKTLRPDLFEEGDERLQEKIRSSLKEILDIQAKPQFERVERYPQALPQYEVGHGERVAQIESLLKNHTGLFLTGNGFHGFGISDCICQAKLTAEKIIFS